jgi:hypothetical protein
MVKFLGPVTVVCGQPWIGDRLKTGNCEEVATYQCDRCSVPICGAHVRNVATLPKHHHFCPSCAVKETKRLVREMVDRVTGATPPQGIVVRPSSWWVRLWRWMTRR